jgi:hypothetical protein
VFRVFQQIEKASFQSTQQKDIKSMSAPAMNIDQRVTVSLALQRYLRAVERFEAASNEFNEACQSIRQALPREIRFVANIMHQHFLVTSDNEGNFEVEQVDTV